MARELDDPTATPNAAGASAPVRESAPEMFQAVDQYMGTPEFAQMIQNEFPDDAAEWLDPVTRRQAMKLMGASAILAGAIGCNPSLKPASNRTLIPYVKKPEQITPGVPLFFATAASVAGVGVGLIAKSHEGRPVKLEGNPAHPGSLGSTDLTTQAVILGLYDPDRSKDILYRGVASTWDKAKAAIADLFAGLKAKKGAPLRILSEATGSPTMAALMAELQSTMPELKWIQYEPIHRESVLAGAKAAFGKYATPIYAFDKADVILSLDGDFLATGPGGVRYARDAMSRRKVRVSTNKKTGDGVSLSALSRIYSVESMLTGISGVADHRLPLKPSQIESFIRALAKELGVAGAPAAGPLPELATQWIKPLAADLLKSKGKAVVVPGDTLSPAAHAIAHAINAKLEANGKIVTFIEPTQAGMTGPTADMTAAGTASLKTLCDEMNAGKVEALLILGGNPVFNAPADLKFSESLAKVAAKIHLGLYQDETANVCDWHINATHELEAWGDVRAYDGTASIQQPLIAPITGGKSAIELIAAILDKPALNGMGIVQATWQKVFTEKKLAGDFDTFWHKCVGEGVIPDTAAVDAKVAEAKLPEAISKLPAPTTVTEELELVFRADPTIYDGRYANNAWLQETPKPITNIAWDNAALVSPATAEKLKCEIVFKWTAGEHGRSEVDIIELKANGTTLKVPVWALPGLADGVIVLNLGYGRKMAGKVGSNTGFDTYTLRTSTNPWTLSINAADGAKRTQEKYLLASTQGQHAMEGRRPARHGTKDAALGEREKVAHDDHFHLEYPLAFSFADNPPSSGAEKGLMRALLPGTPEERERLAEKYKDEGYKNNAKKHDDEGEHEAGHGEHAHAHDARLLPLTLIDDHKNNKLYRRWAMAIDLGSCIGCTACVTACTAENNVAVIGKTEVTRGRIMHWIRIDRYFTIPAEVGGTKRVDDTPRMEALVESTSTVGIHFQPVNCQQCEKAPCEVVCPVAATVHSADGLNDMVYNRCVGTRYCANNCPYKVRRFNFVQYADYAFGTSTGLVNNPEVSMRTRGVMEKCTYCVQRIRNAEIEAEREYANDQRAKDDKTKRPIIKDGEIKTACQAACPAGAISFGDLNYDQYTANGKPMGFSEVARWKLEPTHYGLLAELNTMPRTSYLAAIKNPNKEISALYTTKEA